MKIGLGHSKGAASAVWRPRRATFSEDSFVANNPLPRVEFGKSVLRHIVYPLALMALLGMGGSACQGEKKSPPPTTDTTVKIQKKSKGFVALPADVVVHWTQDSLYEVAAQGLRIHAGDLLENRVKNHLNDVEIFDSLATIAARRSGDDPETFMRLVRDIFFNQLSEEHRWIAGIPKGQFNRGDQFKLGNNGLASLYSDPNDPEQLSKHFLYLLLMAFYRGQEVATRALAINELKWFGEDPSEADIRLGELAIIIGEELRRGKPPSQIDWKGLLSGTSIAVNP